MKEALKNNKKIIIIGIVIIVLLLIGVAFAYLTTTLHGEKEYLVSFCISYNYFTWRERVFSKSR